MNKTKVIAEGFLLVLADSVRGDMRICPEQNFVRVFVEELVIQLAVVLIDRIAPAHEIPDARIDVQIRVLVKQFRQRRNPQIQLMRADDVEFRERLKHVAELF